MRTITIPLYELHELSADAHANALKSVRDMRLALFVEHELPELTKELLAITISYGLVFQFSSLIPFTKNKHVIIENYGFTQKSYVERSEIVARFNSIYLNTPPIDPHQTAPTFRQILGEYTRSRGRVQTHEFISYFVQAMNHAAQHYIERVEKSIDSDSESVQFANEIGYEFTERGDIFDHYVKGGDYHVME